MKPKCFANLNCVSLKTELTDVLAQDLGPS